MSFNSIGDLAQGFALRHQNTALKQQMDRLATELASGLTADVSQHLSGNLLHLADVQHKLELSQSYQRGADQGRVETSVMQLALDSVQTTTQDLSLTALTIGASPGAIDFEAFANEARGTLTTVFAALNANVGGRSLFSGDEVTRSPLASSSDFIAAIQAAVAGSVTAGDVTTALDTFFDPAGGFETLIYQGGSSARNAYQLGDGESVSLDLRANDPAIRAVLKQIAIASVLDDPGVTLTNGEQHTLTQQIGQDLLGAESRIIDIRSDLGFAESRIDRAATRLSAEQTSLSLVQTQLLAVDPYDTATELETVQLRLETLYTITSRMSRLNLVNYL